MSQCRGCKRPITWWNTENGKKIPVDAEPSEDGNVMPLDGQTVRVMGPIDVAIVRQNDPDVLLFMAHHATCPNAADFKGKR